jgi:hypothetical protein
VALLHGSLPAQAFFRWHVASICAMAAVRPSNTTGVALKHQQESQQPNKLVRSKANPWSK